MNDTFTHLEPLPVARARALVELMQSTARADGSALALDDAGRVTVVVPADAADEPHLLGDLDVHA
jgi:hypothetical protein